MKSSQKNIKWIILGVILVVIIIATIVIVSVTSHHSGGGKSGPKQPTVIDDEYIIQKFNDPNGLMVVMSGGLDSTAQEQAQKIYLKNNVFSRMLNPPNGTQVLDGVIDVTYLSSQLPINVYAQNPQATVIGLILDPSKIYASKAIKCMFPSDSNSDNRGCVGTLNHTCQTGSPCKSSMKDYQAVAAGCSIHHSDPSGTCNTVKWCDKLDPSQTDAANLQNAIKQWSNNPKWNTVSQGCVFRGPTTSNNDPNLTAYVEASRGYRKEHPSPVGMYNETELDGVLNPNLNNKLWLDSIIGVFHTADPGQMQNCGWGLAIRH